MNQVGFKGLYKNYLLRYIGDFQNYGRLLGGYIRALYGLWKIVGLLTGPFFHPMLRGAGEV